MELSTMITRAQQQRNATATQFDSSEFFARRMEEYERTLSVLTTRSEESYAQEICLISNLHQLLGILNELRCHFEGIAEESERDIDSFEESATQPIVSTTRNGEVGRPRVALAREQLETLHGDVGFRCSRLVVVRRRRLKSTTTNGSLRSAEYPSNINPCHDLHAFCAKACKSGIVRFVSGFFYSA